MNEEQSALDTDLLITGESFSLGGVRIDPSTVSYEDLPEQGRYRLYVDAQVERHRKAWMDFRNTKINEMYPWPFDSRAVAEALFDEWVYMERESMHPANRQWADTLTGGMLES